VPVFIIAGSTYLVSLVAIHFIVPGLEPAKFDIGSTSTQ